MCVFCIGSTPYKGEDEVCVCICVCVCVCVHACVHMCECVFCLALGFTRYKGENEVCLERRGDSVCAWGGGGVQEGPTTIHIIIKELGGISVAGGLESMPRKGEDEVYVSVCGGEGIQCVCEKEHTTTHIIWGGGGGRTDNRPHHQGTRVRPWNQHHWELRIHTL